MVEENYLLKEGIGEFEIDIISDRDLQGNYHTSKAGNRLIKAKLHVLDSNHEVDSVWINIVHEHLYRLRDLCESVGMVQVYKDYKRGVQCLEELIGKEGKCEIVIKRDEKYGDKTDIKRFIPHRKTQAIKINEANQEFGDVPF